MKNSYKVIGLIVFTITIVFIIFFFGSNYFRTEGLGLLRALKQISYSTEDLLASVIYSNEKIFIPLEFQKQEHSVTCEVAALRMALSYFGHHLTEEELLKRLDFSTKEPKSPTNIWGDPDEGFVGDINGSIFLGTGYGVYAKPIRNLALSYRDAFILEKPTLPNLLREVEKGKPVIVWGLLSGSEPKQWTTEEGKKVLAFVGEHARVVIGYSGSVSNPSHIVMMDPIYGKIRMGRDKFLSDWNKLGNMNVVIY